MRGDPNAGYPAAKTAGKPCVLAGATRNGGAPQHRPEDALADARAAAARSGELGVCHPVFAGWRAEAVEALIALGKTNQARRLAREQLELAEQLGTPGARGAARRVLARTMPEPLPLLEQAVATLAGSPARLEHTRALVALGAALRRANRRADARVPLRRALEQADHGGMLLLARRAREELNAVGARPRRSALSGPGALTPAEHRVAQLAARGHGNRAIAEPKPGMSWGPKESFRAVADSAQPKRHPKPITVPAGRRLFRSERLVKYHARRNRQARDRHAYRRLSCGQVPSLTSVSSIFRIGSGSPRMIAAEASTLRAASRWRSHRTLRGQAADAEAAEGREERLPASEPFVACGTRPGMRTASLALPPHGRSLLYHLYFFHGAEHQE